MSSTPTIVRTINWILPSTTLNPFGTIINQLSTNTPYVAQHVPFKMVHIHNYVINNDESHERNERNHKICTGADKLAAFFVLHILARPNNGLA
jgi:hypothetical protein